MLVQHYPILRLTRYFQLALAKGVGFLGYIFSHPESDELNSLGWVMKRKKYTSSEQFSGAKNIPYNDDLMAEIWMYICPSVLTGFFVRLSIFI